MNKQAQCKKKHFKPKHQKSKLFRANEPLLSVFMWGVNQTVNELDHVNIPVMLMPDDFRAFTKIRVDNHLYQKDVMPSHFKVKEYCPLVFRNLRERFSIFESDYLTSLTKLQPVAINELSGKQTKFYSTYDNQLILKTLTSDEVENMHHLLKEYHPYIVERYGKTLLPQYLGMYRLTVEGQVTYIVVMRNIFNSRLAVHRKYDLRERETSEKEGGPRVAGEAQINLDSENRAKLMGLLEADTKFLAKENYIEYYLSLGVHDQQEVSQEEDEDSGSGGGAGGGVTGQDGDSGPETGFAASSSGKQIYFLGLVGLRKRVVGVHAEEYRRRFMDFISKAVNTSLLSSSSSSTP